MYTLCRMALLLVLGTLDACVAMTPRTGMSPMLTPSIKLHKRRYPI